MERYFLAEVVEDWTGVEPGSNRGDIRSKRISPIFSSSSALDAWIERNPHVRWLDWCEVVHQWGRANEFGLLEEKRTNLEYWFA